MRVTIFSLWILAFTVGCVVDGSGDGLDSSSDIDGDGDTDGDSDVDSDSDSDADGSSFPTGEILVFFNWGSNYLPQVPTHTNARNTIVEENIDVTKDCGPGVVCRLYHTDDDWETWGPYRQYRIVEDNGVEGPLMEFTGIIDIKALIDGDDSFNQEHWLSRLEIGNETFQNSSGTTTIHSLDLRH